MLFLINNRTLTQDREKTFLTASVAVAATTLTVKAVDTNSWADNDWIIVGEIGTPNAEVLQINGAVSDGTSLTIDNAGSGGARFAHSVDEPVYRIDYNQVRFYRATTDDSSATSVLTTIELQPDDYETRYEDTSNTTGFGFARFYNSLTTALSPFSDGIPYTGQSPKSLNKLVEKVRTLLDQKTDDFIHDEEIIEALNDKQRDIVHERLWTFNEVERSQSSVANTFEYAVDSDIKELHTVRFDTQPLVAISQARWEMLHWDTDQTTSDPTHVGVFVEKMKFYPRPASSANTTTLDGGITASATTITVVSTSAFKRGDYYRFIINDEVIYATAATSTTFTGCLRAREGTTASTHDSGDTVTERNIVYTGQLEPTDLANNNDETIIPEPIVLANGAAAELAHGKLEDHARGDRLDAKYTLGLDNLRDRYTLKVTSQFTRIKDPREVISDDGRYPNANDFPTDVTAF